MQTLWQDLRYGALTLIALLTGLVSARRMTEVDPMIVLRCD